jgi:hypothetical protein
LEDLKLTAPAAGFDAKAELVRLTEADPLG